MMQYSPESPPVGVLAELISAELINGERWPARRLVRDVVLGAIPRSNKVDLGCKQLVKPEGQGSLLVYGGQDTVGAKLFDGGRITGMFVAADGCSFGDRQETADAARYAVQQMLRIGGVIAKKSQIPRVELLRSWMAPGVQIINKNILDKFPNGATTLTVVAISHEEVEGRNQIYAHIMGVGDGQVLVWAQNHNGEKLLLRIVDPADLLDRKARQMYPEYFAATPGERGRIRMEIAAEITKARSEPVELVQRKLEESGIYAFLGRGGISHGTLSDVRMLRVNLSNDFFRKGYQRLRFIVCTDNVGSKLGKEVVGSHISENNRDTVGKLIELMRVNDADDGSLVMFEVGRIAV